MYDFRTDGTGDEVSVEEARFAELFNAYREANGLSAARFSSELSAAGNRHAQDAEQNGWNGHDFSDGTASSDFYTYEFLAPYGYGQTYETSFWGAWENAHSSAGGVTADSALASWDGSAAHKAAMLDSVVTEFGIGITDTKAFLVFGTGSTTTFTGPVVTVGTASAETIRGVSYSDQVTSGDGSDVVSGAAGADVLYGNVGDDVLYGNQGADTIFGGKDADRIFGGQDADQVYGNLADDVLYGNFADDYIHGGAGNDTIFGGQDSDTIVGGVGDDLLFGNLGGDRFEFAGGGNDTIGGFDGAAGDRLALNSLGGYSVGADVSGNALISFSSGSVTLTGVDPANLQADWIV